MFEVSRVSHSKNLSNDFGVDSSFPQALELQFEDRVGTHRTNEVTCAGRPILGGNELQVDDATELAFDGRDRARRIDSVHVSDQ